MSHTRLELQRLFMTKSGLAVIALLLFFSFPSLETTFAPTMKPIHEISFVAVEGGTIITASAEKVRNCAWRQTIFYYGERGGRNTVTLSRNPHRGPPRQNAAGILTWDAIFLPVDVETARDETHADALHSCYPLPEWAPWATYWTRSKFYDPLTIETAVQ